MTRGLRVAAAGRKATLARASRAGKAIGLAAAFTVAALSPAAAQGLPGERLYQLCRDRTSTEWREAGHWICPSYIRGLIDGARLQALRNAGNSLPGHYPLLAICDPATATGDEAIRIVVRYLEARPEMRPNPAAVAVFQALSEAWPCGQ